LKKKKERQVKKIVAKGIYRRGNVYWIRYAGLDGKIVRESTGSRRFQDAETLLTARKKAIDDGKEPEIKKIANYSFRELTERYLSWVKGRQRSANIKEYVVNQLLEKFGNLPLRRFSTALIEQLQTDIINKGRKPATNNKTLNILKHMFSKAVDWDMVESETLKRIRKVKPLKDEGKRLRYLTQEECTALIHAAESHLKPIVITALNTGMRKSEILNLQWDNVDLKHGFILLSQDQTKNAERKEIPINNTLRETLQGITRRLDSPYVFYVHATGKPYHVIKRSFSTACRRAKIKDFRFHDLRHTFASHLVMAGIDLTTVKELLGHKDIKMTLRYAHLAPSHKVKAVDILDKTLNRTPTAQLVHNLAFGG
jgi:integrase